MAKFIYLGIRNCGATLRLRGGGGSTISAPILGGGDTRHFFLLTLYNFKNSKPYPAVPGYLGSAIYKNKNLTHSDTVL